MATKQAKQAVRETLAEYVRRVRGEKRLSLEDVQRNSRRHGAGISRGYVSQIENGYYRNPTPEKLRGLAAGLGVSEEELFALARGEASASISEFQQGEYEKMFEDVQAELTPDEMAHFNSLMAMVRREVDRMIREHKDEG